MATNMKLVYDNEEGNTITTEMRGFLGAMITDKCIKTSVLGINTAAELVQSIIHLHHQVIDILVDDMGIPQQIVQNMLQALHNKILEEKEGMIYEGPESEH